MRGRCVAIWFAPILSGLVACAGASPSGRTAAPTAAGPPSASAPASITAVASESATVAAPAVASASPPAPQGPELPRGGRTIFPRYRLVGYCGTPGAPELGKLAGNLAARAKEIAKLGEQYAGDREALPTFELIAVVVQGVEGPDKKWRRRVPGSVVDDYLKAARAAKGILLLNIQPGHSDFMTEVKAFEGWLREPDVGVALDPEWAMTSPKQRPGVHWGQTTGEVVSEVAAYLSGIVAEHKLPEKVLVFHQVNDHVFKNEQALRSAPGVVIVKSVDGLGLTGAKIKTYQYLIKSMPADVRPGFKLFFDEDVKYGGRLMAPKEVMALSPVPDYVMYE